MCSLHISKKFGNEGVLAAVEEEVKSFSAEEWTTASAESQEEILQQYRLTYLAEAQVNWCPALGTVLANDEIVNGVSERGGHPVVRKKMLQWSMRISAYAERLLQDLDLLDWPQPLKDSQTNWIGKSKGAMVTFHTQPSEWCNESLPIEVFTTRPDTIYGVSFMTLAPEHPYVDRICSPEQKASVTAYVQATAKRSERDRMADVKTIFWSLYRSLCKPPNYRGAYSCMDWRLCFGGLWNWRSNGGSMWGPT
jgi:leucyl-tRNA synthetase